jgi:hypothetical protein
MNGLYGLKPRDRVEVVYTPGPLTKPITERVWVFEEACADGGAHTVSVLPLLGPLRCATCGVEAAERERKVER